MSRSKYSIIVPFALVVITGCDHEKELRRADLIHEASKHYDHASDAMRAKDFETAASEYDSSYSICSDGPNSQESKFNAEFCRKAIEQNKINSLKQSNGNDISFSEFYAKSQTGTLEQNKNYVLSACVNVCGAATIGIDIRSPDYKSNPTSYYLSAIPQFYNPSELESLLNRQFNQTATIVLSMVGKKIYIHKIN